ncbi:hypothetical protein Cgig2_019193 [Carnegiea gigantea]|uniref:Cytochrome P450 n=1 Tax=Carnegiea gigantea TaxID=171969 RepID=A0A9Q1K3D6_9CARY|nr:hypothetical protein Cgig2_019193 [Carnegiea gigantea]
MPLEQPIATAEGGPAPEWPAAPQAGGGALAQSTLSPIGPSMSLWQTVFPLFTFSQFSFNQFVQILGYNNTILAWAPYGDHWRNLRRILTFELLSAHRLYRLSSIRHDEVGLLIQWLHKQSFGGEVEVEMKMVLFELTYHVIMRMIAGDQSCTGDNKGARFRKVLEEIYVAGGFTNVGDFLPFLRKIGVKGLEKKFLSIHEKSDNLLQEMVEEQRSKMGERDDNDQDKRKMNENKPMIQVLLELQRMHPEYYTDEIIKGLILVILIGGTDKSAMTMEWTLSLLLKNPTVLQKAQAEIDDQVGQDRLISESNLVDLPYLHCIMNETLRMYPPAPLTPHESAKDSIVEGYHVPHGTILFVNLWAIQNDPKVWDEPRQFRPERFDGIKGNRMGYKSMPLGSGRRGCPGDTLAIRMVGLTLGALIQCFEWDRVGENLVDMEEGAGLTMPKAKPLIAMIRPRRKAFEILSQIRKQSLIGVVSVRNEL